jgi:hypothetical protein
VVDSVGSVLVCAVGLVRISFPISSADNVFLLELGPMFVMEEF